MTKSELSLMQQVLQIGIIPVVKYSRDENAAQSLCKKGLVILEDRNEHVLYVLLNIGDEAKTNLSFPK